VRPRLADRGGWAAFIGTPKGHNEFHKIWERAKGAPEWFRLMLKGSDSGLVAQSELDEMRSTMSEDQYEQEVECSFEAAILGAYFGKEMRAADLEGRITVVDRDPSVPVHTAWDIGYRDDTAIWFYQVVRGEIHVIDYHASSGQAIPFYAELIQSKGYRYGTHWLPHDARAKTLASGGKSIVEQLGNALGGPSKLAIVPSLDIQDGIQAARVALGRCWFDETKCAEGLEALRQYQREYDEDKKAFRERPRHDWTSHPADAFRMLAVAWRQEAQPESKAKPKFFESQTLDELWQNTEQEQAWERRI